MVDSIDDGKINLCEVEEKFENQNIDFKNIEVVVEMDGEEISGKVSFGWIR